MYRIFSRDVRLRITKGDRERERERSVSRDHQLTRERPSQETRIYESMKSVIVLRIAFSEARLTERKTFSIKS